MSTDFQQARSVLGLRLRELRESSPGVRLTGSVLAGRLGWAQSKVSKLETGRQTATVEDLRAWAEATGQPESFDELHAQLKGLESRVRSWRRQLASGHRPVQETWNALVAEAREIHSWESALVAGMLQTADYARHVFLAYAELQQSPRDTEEAVRSRMRRQEWLYRPGHRLRLLMWEAALRTSVCPPAVLAAQLDRLSGVIGLDTVSLGIVPLDARVKIPPANSFSVLDGRLVVAEDWHAELWLDDAPTVATYQRVWRSLSESAVFGADAQRLITTARRHLDT
ncbi:helix-turn-helix domain-containing protein [Streptomyces sp. NPDC051567]|uniref:helix-turn-helix domain-containing protein n=1 Tax=Streptomyces sp. NPDC051567 TaxID=3365660 RepID=UPI003787A1D2